MFNKRSKFTDEEKELLAACKESVSDTIHTLLNNKVRKTNIQIELEWFIRDILQIYEYEED